MLTSNNIYDDVASQHVELDNLDKSKMLFDV